MKNIKRIIFIIVPILLLTVLFLFSLLSKRVAPNPPGTVGNTAGNLNNNGLFCEDEGVVYFSNPYDNNTLYSMDPDETNIKKLSNAQINSINAAGGYLYYYQASSAASNSFSSLFRINGLYRCKKDGKSAVCLKRVPVPSLSLVGNTVFYQSYDTKEGTSLCRIDIDKKNYEVLEDYVINPAGVQNNTIYFGGTQDDHYLYSLNTETNAVSTIYRGDVYNPIAQGDFIYYMDISSNYRLCRYSLSSQTAEVLTRDRIDFFNVAGDWIYYQKSHPTEPALKRIRTDGSGEEIVVNGVYENINATSTYVYFNAFDAPTPVYHTPVNGPVSVGTFTPSE